MNKEFVVLIFCVLFVSFAASAAPIELSRATPVYREASRESEVLGRYPAGTRFKKAVRDGNWYKIKLSRPYRGTDVAWIAMADIGGAGGSSEVRSRSRSGEGESHPSKFELAPELLYGMDASFRFGFGVRGGLYLARNLNVNGRFEYFLGSSRSTDTGTSGAYGYGGTTVGTNVGSNVSSNSKAWLFSGDVGYDLELGTATLLRPFIGLGYVSVAASSTVTGTAGASASAANIGFIPGAALLSTSRSSFYGAEAKYIVVEGSGVLAAGVLFGFRL